MGLQKKWIEKQNNSEWLWLDAVEYFLGLHGLEDIANEIRLPTDSNGKKIPTKKFYCSEYGQTIKKGRLIRLLKRHHLWAIYAEQYWPNRSCEQIKNYLKKAEEWSKKSGID